MQFSSLITILTVAMTAAALPAADVANNNVVVARTGGGGGTPVNECSVTNEKPVCCTGGLLGLIDLSCLVAAVGGICSGNVKCCNVDKNVGQALITIDILTCGIL
ncbi:putative hydrophobin precursor [Triangularia verruculosa]|uniref:Hydrophobin n=1 Tax=Triangularia verruculosa TaxID=2587418 RepID=A0AAN6XSN6_9PEZI|nr:putative hydrophobin precursor [Triangularia verruculosa]